jgi:tripartite-type tricarboxylate transporter receptor subunit TctC
MSPQHVGTLSKAALSSLETKEVKDRFFASGVEMRPASADEFGKLIRSEMDKWAKVVKNAGLKAD